MHRGDYKEFVIQFAKGEILMDIELALARRFFIDSDESRLVDEVGEPLHKERFWIGFCGLLGIFSLIAGILLSVIALKWYSIVAIPLMVKMFQWLTAEASLGKGTLSITFGFIIICFYFAYYFSEILPLTSAWLIILPLPVFFSSLMYKLTTTFLRSLVLRNEKAFDFLINNVFIAL